MNGREETNLDNAQAQMRKGILEYCILLVISQGKAYASDILKILKKSDLIVVEGTLYPLLSRLKNAGMLDYNWQESKSGPPRKYYSLTSKGRASLKRLDGTWQSLSASIAGLRKKS